mgnify:CR=1 FL=1
MAVASPSRGPKEPLFVPVHDGEIDSAEKVMSILLWNCGC